jgi:hypothetical protein
VGRRLDAEDVWASQQAAETGDTAVALPQLHVFLVTEVLDELHYSQLRACIQSICNQWRAPPEHTLVSWHAAGDQLRSSCVKLLAEFQKCFDNAAPFIAYNDGPARAVRCRTTVLEQMERAPQSSQVRRLMEFAPQADTTWVCFSDGMDLWHPCRTALLRNFLRQLGGPERCLAAGAPVMALALNDAASTITDPVEVNKLLQQGKRREVGVSYELQELAQCCLRRSLLALFLDRGAERPEDHGNFSARLLQFVVRDNAERLLQVSPEQLREGGKSVPLWMYFRRGLESLCSNSSD